MDYYDLIKWSIGIAVILASIFYTIRHFKIMRTIAYIERFNNPAMIEIKQIVDEWSRKSEEEKMKVLEEDFKVKYKINLIYSLITEIGISYQKRIINRRLTCLIFDPMIPEYWEKLKFFIVNQPNREYPKGYSFEKIAKVIINSRSKRFKKRRALKMNIFLKENLKQKNEVN